MLRAVLEAAPPTVIVVFGADDGPVLLGVYTLEGPSLAADPVQQRLVPTALIL